MLHKFWAIGKAALTGVALASTVFAVLLGWAGFLAESKGSLDSAVAMLLMAGALAYASGGLLCVLWKRTI